MFLEKYQQITYYAPESLKSGCESAKEVRTADMLSALHLEHVTQVWYPDERDIVDEERILLSGVLTGSKKFGVGKNTMSQESRKLMEQGKLPTKKGDKRWVTKTYS